MSNEVLIGIGIGVVLSAAIIGGCIVVSKNRKIKLGESKNSQFLKSDKIELDFVDAERILPWFDKYENLSEDEKIQMIVDPNGKKAQELHLDDKVEIGSGKCLVQIVLGNKKILGIRTIQYNEIESNLQATLLEDDGVIVVKD